MRAALTGEEPLHVGHQVLAHDMPDTQEVGDVPPV